MIIELPMSNGESQQQIGSPIKLSDHEPVYAFTGAALGQHSREILAELGYTQPEIEALYAQQVVAG